MKIVIKVIFQLALDASVVKSIGSVVFFASTFMRRNKNGKIKIQIFTFMCKHMQANRGSFLISLSGGRVTKDS